MRTGRVASLSSTLALVLCGLSAVPAPATSANSLYPQIEPQETGRLTVSDRHELYWEVSGAADGIPLVALHGGPGGRSSPTIRRLFDPRKYRIVQFDQRGAGRSSPFADWRENTTQLLISDIDAIRARLGIERPTVFFGLSWGTTLALAYAEMYPEKVAGLILLGVFTCRASEIDHLYHGGIAPFFPEAWEMLRSIVPDPRSMNYPQQLFAKFRSQQQLSDGMATFVTYEEWLSTSQGSREEAAREASEPQSRSLAVLENHYLANGCFLEEGQLLRNAGRLSGIPVFLANGRLDLLTPPATAIDLAKRLDRAELEIVPGAGHVDLAVALAGVRGADWMADAIHQINGPQDGARDP